ncbi:MAG: GH116 family glycosyl-hydrolase [Candidatus Brocadiia bacterium]
MRSAACLFCLFAAALAAAGEPASARYARIVAAEPGLEAYWRFEGGLADAQGALDGEPRGGEPAYTEGPSGGQALRLAEGRLVTMGAAPALDLAETTVELWFRPEFPAEGRGNPCLVAKRESSAATRFSFHVWRDYSCLAFWNGRQVSRFAPAGEPLRKGQWYHLAAVCAGGKLRVYLDALPCRRVSGSGSFALEAKELPLLVGAAGTKGFEPFEGAVDELAVYSRPLAAQEIEEHMDAMDAKKRITAEELAARQEQARREREQRRKRWLAERMSDDVLFAPGQKRVYRAEALEAIRLPVGGIGTGSVHVDGRAAWAVWQVFNNMTQAHVPHSFFAVRVASGDGEPVLRALQSEAVGPFPAIEGLSFQGEYPFGWFQFEDPALPVRVSLETFNPLVPLDVRSSAIPCAITRVTVANPGPEVAEVSVLASQQNAVGFTGEGAIEGRRFPGYGGNRNRVRRALGATFLDMAGGSAGSMTLAALDEGASASARWASLEELAADFRDGALGGPQDAGPTPEGRSLDGALAAGFTLQPGASRTVSFALAWHFPQGRHGKGAWGGEGNMYANWWPDAAAVADEVVGRFDELGRLTRLYHDTFYASNLPHWLLDRIASQVVVLRCPTTFWTRDGYFGGWEGCSRNQGCCYGNCNHVWHYAQAHARLFPAIARRMREQELAHQADDGAVPHRQPSSHPAFDGQCGTILGAYREHLVSPDGAWLARHWPRVKKATDYLVTRWDADHDGVLAGPQWNTLDGNLGGSTSWLGTLYLAALAAAEQMARLQGDDDAADRYRAIRQAGGQRQDETLFNGHYYIQIPDPEPQQDYADGCHIDQLLGQWWAWQLDLGTFYPLDHVRTALGSLFRHNFRTDFRGVHQAPRKFVDEADAGMQMITWPRGERPPHHMRYADEVMSGFEYSAAATMVYAGLMRRGFVVLRAAAERYDGRLRTGLAGAAWGYSGNPFGDDECGKFYARPMSIWSVLLACQGYVADGPAGLIGFRPAWKPDDHASFFTAAEGWGLFRQTRTPDGQTDILEVRYGRLRPRTLVFELPEDAEPQAVSVTVGQRQLAAAHSREGRQLTITLEARTTVPQGQTLAVTARW